ncbi:MAG TPA: ABC transporter permease, partial [Chthoniobacterales bacterium]
QIDALRALAVHPTDYLVVPRVLAMMISMPLLVAECIFFGILAGFTMATKVLGVNAAYYLENMYRFTQGEDILMGLTKGFCFAVIIVIVSCREGLLAKDGAVGVGRATTEAVVISSLAVLVANFFLTMALNIPFPAGTNE